MWVKTLSIVALVALVSACSKDSQTQYLTSQDLDQNYVWTNQEENPFSPFVAASLAEFDSDDKRAANYYMEALKAAPDNVFITEKAFLQMVTSGMIKQASSLAPTLRESQFLAAFSYMVSSTTGIKYGDAGRAQEGGEALSKTTFGPVFQPLLVAWSAALMGDREKAIQALGDLGGRPALRGLSLEHKAYVLDYLGFEQDAEMAYKAAMQSGQYASVPTVAAYADFLYRANRHAAANKFLTQEMKKQSANLYLLREAQRLMMGLGPSLRIATPSGAMAHFYFRMASESMRDQPNIMTLIYGRLAEFLAPDNADVKLMLGDALVEMQRYADAAESYGAIPRSSPAYKTSVMRSIKALEAGAQYDAAADLLQAELLTSPNNRRLLLALADIYREAGRCEEAVVHYSRIITTFGRQEKTIWYEYFARGICYDEMDNWPQAERDLFVANKLNPNNAIILNYLGYSLLIRDSRLEQALGYIERAAEQEPENGSIIDSLGWLQYRTGDITNALISLEKAVKLSPENTTINDHLGDVYWVTGRKREARFQWRHALTLVEDPDQQMRLKDKVDFGLADDKSTTSRPR